MKKFKISVAAVLLAGGSLFFTNCIGSFSLTKSVIDWNKGVGSKFVNELVFIAFWILPVYEVTAIADLLVLNSIEFWTGSNPMTASTKTVSTDHGTFTVVNYGKGCTITEEETGMVTRLNFDKKTKTWSVAKDGKEYPFMTMIDKDHVKMITPEGDFRLVELSEAGVMGYSEAVNFQNSDCMAMSR